MAPIRSSSAVPDERIRAANVVPARLDGEYVLYWMIAARRLDANFALDRAIEWARAAGRPLVVLEALRIDYPHASRRLHQFIIEGMADNGRRLARSPVLYYPYVERRPGQGKGLLARLAVHAVVVVTDEFPCFFLPRMVDAAAKAIDARLEVVDSNGLVPVRAGRRAFTTARAFRRFVQARLLKRFEAFPNAAPLARLRLPRLAGLPRGVTQRWPPESLESLRSFDSWAAKLPIDHAVPPARQRGGHTAARRTLDAFIDRRLVRYATDRSHPDLDGTSRLSPYLHFGHIAVHEVFRAVARHERWNPSRLAPRPGQREGWWGVLPGADAFLDELIVWREIGWNAAVFLPGYDRFRSLPDWARKTLGKHLRDRRPFLYRLAELESSSTHDELWNAAQRQLVRDGWFHGYLRMLWGKKILEWSRRPGQALDAMAALMDKYSLDGRDPSSYAGYFWVLGRYDHPWPPERPIFGLVRYMTSTNTRRKVKVKRYLQEYGPAPGQPRSRAAFDRSGASPG
jgi:deoxyribodipyrimidine photo-lyase